MVTTQHVSWRCGFKKIMEKEGSKSMDVSSAEGPNIKQNEVNPLRQTQAKIVRAPRKIIWEFPLMMFTMSIYLGFWAVGRARDLKIASGKDYQPWLWFFTPYIWLAGAVAYGSMFKNLEAMESRKERDQWRKWAGLWFAVFILISLFFNFQERLQISFVFFFVALIIFCGLFTLLHRRFNQWKLQDSRLSFKGKSSGYTWYEWLTLIICVPIFCFTAYTYVWPILKTINVPSYEDQQAIVIDDPGFMFTVHGNKWKQIDSGEADFRMIEPGSDTEVFVYNYIHDQTIDDITQSRFEIVNISYSETKCSETKQFDNDGRGVRSIMSCTGSDYVSGYYMKLTSIVSEIDGKLMEFVGITLNATKAHANRANEKIYDMANSFRVNQGADSE